MKLAACIVTVLLSGTCAGAWSSPPVAPAQMQEGRYAKDGPAPMKEVINTKDAPAAIGPYSQAIRAGSTMFLSGQIAIDPKTGQLKTGPIEEQVAQVLDNLKAVLAADGMTMDNVVSTTVYVKDLNDFTKLNTVYGTYFKDKPPARATVQVQRIPKDAAVEISAIAVR